MAKPLADRLEALSGYKHLYPPVSADAHLNPVNYSFVTFKLGGKTYYVLSRIADAGLDYTQRTNKIAHHVVLEGSELAPAGPAWLMSQPGFFETRWEGEPRLIEARRLNSTGELPLSVCRGWKAVAGDAGWAGVLAERLEHGNQSDAYVVFPPSTDSLGLVREAQSLLPPPKRWGATFSTFFSKLSPGIECAWRFVPAATPEAITAKRSHGSLIIDLSASGTTSQQGELIEAARTGKPVRVVEKIAVVKAEDPVINAQTSFTEAPPLRKSAPATAFEPPSALPPPMPAPHDPMPRNGNLNSRNSVTPWRLVTAAVLAAFLTGAVVTGGVFLWRKSGRAISRDEAAKPSDESPHQEDLPHTDIEPDVTKGAGVLENKAAPTDENTDTDSAGELVQGSAQQRAAPPSSNPQPASGQGSPGPRIDKSPPAILHSQPPINLFANIDKSIEVLPAVWSQTSSTWTKPVPMGRLASGDSKIAIRLHGIGDRNLIVSERESAWSILNASNIPLAEIRTESIEDEPRVFFVWLDAAQRAPKDVEAISWSCIELSSQTNDAKPSTCFVLLRPKAGKAKVALDAPFALTKSLVRLEHSLSVPRSQKIVARFQIEDRNTRAAIVEKELGDPYDYAYGNTFPITIRAIVLSDKDTETGAEQAITLSVEALATTELTETPINLSDAIKQKKGRIRKGLLIDAIQDFASSAARASGGFPNQLIIEGLNHHFPHLPVANGDYLTALNSLSVSKLEGFAEVARKAANLNPSPQLVANADLVENWTAYEADVPKNLKIHVQLVRQILGGTDKSPIAELEVFRAGRPQAD